MIFVSNRL